MSTLSNPRAEPKPNSVRRAALAVGAAMLSLSRAGRGLVVATATLVILTAPALATPSAPPNLPACPGGFPYVMTLPDALARYAGYYTVEEIYAGFALHDKNGHGFWCYKLHPDEGNYPFVFFSTMTWRDEAPRTERRHETDVKLSEVGR
jgi:hypothetical protein